MEKNKNNQSNLDSFLMIATASEKLCCARLMVASNDRQMGLIVSLVLLETLFMNSVKHVSLE